MGLLRVHRQIAKIQPNQASSDKSLIRQFDAQDQMFSNYILAKPKGFYKVRSSVRSYNNDFAVKLVKTKWTRQRS